MRIISGQYKGRRFSGKIPPNIRPTQDALRETIFNIISNYFDLEDKVVADLCAGTGALAIEALSRYAEYAYFVDISKQSLNYISSNCQLFGIEPQQYKTQLCKAENFFDKYDRKHNIDVVFTDPPYSSGVLNKIIDSASQSENFPIGAYFVAEYGTGNALIIPDNFKLISERNFTISRFSLFEKV